MCVYREKKYVVSSLPGVSNIIIQILTKNYVEFAKNREK